MSDQSGHNVPRGEADPLIARVGNAVIDLLPPDWDAAVLEVAVGRQGSVHWIFHPNRPDAGRLTPSPELTRLTDELHALFRRYGPGWARARVEVTETADGAWDYAADFGFH